MAKAKVVSANGKSVNLRSEPSMKSKVLEQIKVGSEVDVLQQYDTVWTNVQHGDKHGYMMTEFLHEEEPLPFDEDDEFRLQVDRVYGLLVEALNILGDLGVG